MYRGQRGLFHCRACFCVSRPSRIFDRQVVEHRILVELDVVDQNAFTVALVLARDVKGFYVRLCGSLR